MPRAVIATSGIEAHEQDGVGLRVYGTARTVTERVKFRNRLGIAGEQARFLGVIEALGHAGK